MFISEFFIMENQKKTIEYKFKAFEPLKECRFIINVIGTVLPDYLFREYRIYNDGEDLLFETSFMETVHFSFNPKEVFNINTCIIDFLDPTGVVVNSLRFNVKGLNYERSQSYKNGDELQLNHLKFIIDKESMNLLYENKI